MYEMALKTRCLKVKMRKKLLLFACFVVSVLPWAGFVALCMYFGIANVLLALLKLVLGVIFGIIAVLVIRGCTLELYEHVSGEVEQ